MNRFFQAASHRPLISALPSVPTFDWGNALTLNGATRIESNANVGVSGASPWSMAAWVKSDGPASSFKIAMQVGTNASGAGVWAGVFTGTGVNKTFHLGSYGAFTDIDSEVWPQTDEVYLLTVTYDGTTLRMYVDGIEVAEVAVTLALIDAPFKLGGRDGGGLHFEGSVGKSAFWTSELTSSEVASMAADPTVMASPAILYELDETSGTVAADTGSASNNGTVSGTATWQTWGVDQILVPQPYMLVGDSNVKGYGGNYGGIRPELEAAAVLRDRKYTSLGTLVTDIGPSGGLDWPAIHEGVGGEDVTEIAERLLGVWTNDTDVILGSSGDPGASNRGALEDVIAKNALSGGAPFVLFLWAGTNDCINGFDVDEVDYKNMVRRAWNMGGASVKHIKLTALTALTDADDNGRVNTFNAALSGWVIDLQAEGIDCSIFDAPSALTNDPAIETIDGIHLTDVSNTDVSAVLLDAIDSATDAATVFDLKIWAPKAGSSPTEDFDVTATTHLDDGTTIRFLVSGVLATTATVADGHVTASLTGVSVGSQVIRVETTDFAYSDEVTVTVVAGTTWTPEDFTGLDAWFEGEEAPGLATTDSGYQLSSGVVEFWRSVNDPENKYYQQTVVADRPAIASDFGPSNVTALDFDGVNEDLTAVGMGLAASDRCVIIVMDHESSAVNQWIVAASSPNFALSLSAGTSAFYAYFDGSWRATNKATDTGEMAIAWIMDEVDNGRIRKKVAGSAAVEHDNGGTPLVHSAIAVTDGHTLGSGDAITGAKHFTGKIRHVIWLNTIPSAADWADFETWLAADCGL